MSWRLEVKKLARELEGLLATLERAGVDEFSSEPGDVENHPGARGAIGRLRELGIRRGAQIGEFGETPIVTYGSSTAGSTAPEVINTAIEEAAVANAPKLLAASGADERHLFLWADSTAEQLNAAMSFDVL